MKKAILLLPLGPMAFLAGCNEPQTANTYTITFVNDDGTVLQQTQVEEGTFPVYEGETPHKDAPAEHEYVYLGWDKDIVKATEDATYKATYDYVFLFGSYPQSLVTDPELIQNIEKYGINDHLDYVTYNDVEYIEFESLVDYTADDGTRIHAGDINKYEVKPIQWKILGNETNKFYTTYKLLDVGYYNHTYIARYINNYFYSSMRVWMNSTEQDGFMWRAFTQEEQARINDTIAVRNDLASTMDEENPFICEDTNDKVFALSRQELRSTNLGFADKDGDDKSRLAITTDFARASGAGIDNDKYAMYWTRSPANNDWTFEADDNVYNVMIGGTIIHNKCDENGRCIRPAIRLL